MHGEIMRVFGDSVLGTPALAYTTPEHFCKVMPFLETRKEIIKMLVFDEVHKIFDRQKTFREAYNSLDTVKIKFPEVPIMALTATLGNTNIRKLCKDYLCSPVLIRGSVNRKNIKLSIANYQMDKNSQKARNDNEFASWNLLSSNLSKLIGERYAIVFMDFANEVKDFSSYLRKKGEIEVMSFHGKGMSETERTKIVEDFNNQEFQVLCATESYEVGVHNPHVDFVARIGCMRNMNVLLQEFGRAGRSEENGAVGLLFINEHKDDQRLGYWLKGCDTSDSEKIRKDYEACWKWVYSIYTGDCLREGVLKYYEEDVIRTNVAAEDCCLSCELGLRKDFDIQKALSLLLKSTKELEAVLKKEKIGVSETKIISWLRGAKQDWLADQSIQDAIDESSTYSKGNEIDGKVCTKHFWETTIHQSVNLGYVDICFHTFELKGNGKSIARTYRTYRLSAEGYSFLQNPVCYCIFSI